MSYHEDEEGGLGLSERSTVGTSAADRAARAAAVAAASTTSPPARTSTTSTAIVRTASTPSTAQATAQPDDWGALLNNYLPAGTTSSPAPAALVVPGESFLTQSAGGIPIWGLLAGGGALVIGAVAVVFMGGKSKAASSAVKPNRSRGRRAKARSQR